MRHGVRAGRGGSIVEAMLEFAQRLYRTAQHAPTESFQDLALVALGEHVRFEAALWFTGRVSAGQVQVHRLHAHRLSPEAALTFLRHCPHALAATAATPGCAHSIDAAELFARAAGQAQLAHARRWGIERQLLIARPAAGEATGEWLSLHRPHRDAPFDEGDCSRLRLLIPHLSESRRVNRALCLRCASEEPLLAAAPHRALTLPEGTVLHCGQRVSEAIGATWAHWDGLRLPAPLLARALRGEAVLLERRGERIVARRFTDSLVLTVRSLPVSERLTRREYEVVRLYAAGRGYREVARHCGLAAGTVRCVLHTCYRKLGINSRGELGRLLAREAGARLEIPSPGR